MWEGSVRRRSGEVAFDRLAGHPVLSRLVGVAMRAPLRVLAYHEIIDATGFRLQMEHIVGRYHPVTSAEVVRWLGGGSLPSDAVWVTFDDGHPSVVDDGLPILADLGLSATMFICPGVVGTNDPYWWQVAQAVAPDEVADLKTVSDAERARRVNAMFERYREETGSLLQQPQLTTEQISEWVGGGCDIGNHTWDHPLLDRCDSAEQDRQIVRAHEWITEHVDPEQLLFAYPNGNRTDHARDVVKRLGYAVALLFDHATIKRPAFELSRLRTNADNEIDRFRSIVSGGHPVLHRLRGGC